MKQALEAEFTAFVADRGQALLRIAHALTGDRDAAADLVQGALAKAYARWPRIHGEAEAYVRKIIYNDRVSAWRRPMRRNEVTVADVPERPEAGRHDHDVTERLALREALLSLPARQRAVLVMRYLEDRTVEETAEVLGCRPGTVASQASRALAKLRELVGGVDDWTSRTEAAR
ncbi:RNA polymerase sigma-70 factor (sigma-E family) [Actinoplanes octamycinicus]|uniref:RNA polymerase sigma-70 factor (Sigma-E family) n=1 Tax=Actinoplanes octamycinicus TaxID=135948 RepID=A0A7W7M5W0_9ACTN|nr:SigE family RNA polymerase sigma factor [Actinoplanes octamycinicus]MBB4738105.1 RNA polymerase sigma-70 factor (sigma-E family) [Actinoplanes octamycinicus]GIE59340.1 DNA-directed RNA polymerase sigma-70 factor [Actinoplanes octamycinicus]